MTLPLDRRHDPAVRLRHVHMVRLAVIAGAALLDSVIAAQTGRHGAATALQLAALAVAGVTFVPGAFHRGLRRSAALSALMTTAAIGAAVLGRFAVAAGLACVFAVFEARAAYHRAADDAAASADAAALMPVARDAHADAFPPAGRDERLVIGFVMVICAAVVVAAAAGRNLEGLHARVELPLLVVVVVAASAAVALHLRGLLRGPPSLTSAGRRR